jgi:hypothetical protein
VFRNGSDDKARSDQPDAHNCGTGGAHDTRLPLRALFAVLLLSAAVLAQTPCADGSASCSSVPRLIRFTGTLVDSGGHPRSGVIGVTFSVYRQATGGSALWQETQNVPLDPQGRYAVLLGMTKTEGLPVEVFNSPEPRWLGVWPQLEGEHEHSRVVLVSVPYALKAADTETLQGLPASAFVRAPTSSSGQTGTTVAVSGSSSASTVLNPPGASATSRSQKPTDSTVTTPGGTPNAVPKFGSATSILNSQITDSNGVVGMQNLANILFADQFSGGVPDAIKACPDAGCVIYAYSPNVNPDLGTVDPGSKSVTLYLGPYTYKVTQITLRSSFKIIGMGGSTFLQSTDGSRPVIVVPQAVNGAAQEVLLSGFHLYGAPGNTAQDAIFLDSSNYFNTGVWYSELRDIIITGFGGIGIHIKGTNADFSGITQFTEFNKVLVFRAKGAGNALRIEGGSYELYFNDCEFDGSGDGTNIFIGGRAPNRYAIPIDINFRGLTSQNAATAVEIDGGWALSFYSPHHEFVRGVYLVHSDLGPVAGLTISDAGFQTSGTNSGAGYLLNVTTPGPSGIRFIHNHIMGPADTVVRVPNGVSIAYQDNMFYGGTNLPVTMGITTQITAASTINIGGSHSVGLIASATPISTIQANLGAGEMATFYAINGPVTFASSGNINLLGAPSITVIGSITFIVTDLGKSPSWVPISQWGLKSSTPNFLLSSSTQILTLAPGATSAADLTLTPQNGFSGKVDFNCAVASPDISCSVLPDSVSVKGPNAVNATVSFAATVNASSTSKMRPFGSSYLALLSFGCMGIAMLPLARPKRNQQVRGLALTAILFLLVLGSVGCGAVRDQSVSDPPRYYFPVVKATSGADSRTVSFLFFVTVH